MITEQTLVHNMCFGPDFPPSSPEVLAVGWASGGRELKRDLIFRLLGLFNPGVGFSTVEMNQTDLGRPVLVLDGQPGPHVSFSFDGKGRVFAALCLTSPVGVDATHPNEFSGAYPFARAFNGKELDQAASLTGSQVDGAALVWAFKEAAVKARGTGFHRIDPRRVMVQELQYRDGRYAAMVQAEEMIPARACRFEDQYLALALDNSVLSPLYS